MAHFDTGIGIETLQTDPPGDNTLQLSSSDVPRPSSVPVGATQEWETSTSRHETQPLLSQIPIQANETKQAIAVPFTDVNNLLLETGHQNHEFLPSGSEAIAMLESPAGSSRRAPSPNDQASDNKVRKVTYASYPPESPSPNPNRRPSRHDSTYYSVRDVESNGSEVDFDTQARQLRSRERIIIRRQRVRRTRHLIKACRKKVHELREEARDAVDQLNRKFNELKAAGYQSQESIEPYHKKLQDAHDNLGPAEDEYDILEKRLDDEEEELEEEENYFYSHNDIFKIAVPQSKVDAALSPLAEPSRPLDPDPEDLELEHALVREYRKKLEEAERLKDDMNDLENEYFEVSGDATFRRKHNIPLSEETTNFLYDEYPKLYAEIVDDLRAVEDALFEIRDKCVEEGLFSEADHTYERWDALCEDLMDLIHETGDRSPLRVAAHYLDYDDKNADFGDKKNYVNKWILQWVEDSTVGALLLQAWIYFEYPNDANKSDELGDEKWSELALEHWDYDEAGELANKNNRDSRLDTIAGFKHGEATKRHATSTGRSGVSTFGTLDVLPDDEVELVMAVGDSLPFFGTQKLGSSHRSSVSSSNKQIRQEPPTTSNIISQPRPLEMDHEVGAKTITTVQDAATHTTGGISGSFQKTQSIATLGNNTSPHTSYTNTDSVAISSTTAQNEIDNAPRLAMVTNCQEHLIDENSTAKSSNMPSDTPRSLPVDNDEVPTSAIPSMALFTHSNINRNGAASPTRNSLPQDSNSKDTKDTTAIQEEITPILDTPEQSTPNFEMSSISDSGIDIATERLLLNANSIDILSQEPLDHQ